MASNGRLQFNARVQPKEDAVYTNKKLTRPVLLIYLFSTFHLSYFDITHYTVIIIILQNK